MTELKKCGHDDCVENGIDWYYSGSSMVGMKVWACKIHGEQFERGYN
jgi:hypothetical protein